MANEDRKVIVKSLVNYKVGFNMPEYHFYREFSKEGEFKPFEFNLLYEGLSNFGIKTLFDEGILYIENKQDRIDLGLEEADEKPQYKIMTTGELLVALKTDSFKDFKEKVNSSPAEQVRKMAELAIKNKVTDLDKCELLLKQCGIDVLASIQNIIEEERSSKEG